VLRHYLLLRVKYNNSQTEKSWDYFERKLNTFDFEMESRALMFVAYKINDLSDIIPRSVVRNVATERDSFLNS